MTMNNGPHSLILRREAFTPQSGFDRTIRLGHEDWDFWLWLMRVSGVTRRPSTWNGIADARAGGTAGGCCIGISTGVSDRAYSPQVREIVTVPNSPAGVDLKTVPECTTIR